MSRQVQRRRGTTVQNDAFTGAVGEFSYDTETKRIRTHDGSTVGGTEMATLADVASATTQQMVFTGEGSPEGVVTAPVGALYTEIQSANLVKIWAKVSGTGNTGWV